MSEHRYDIRISESCVDPNPLMVERQDPVNFNSFQTRERCALEIAAYVFKITALFYRRGLPQNMVWVIQPCEQQTLCMSHAKLDNVFRTQIHLSEKTRPLYNVTPCLLV